jgi:hypothetical protein
LNDLCLLSSWCFLKLVVDDAVLSMMGPFVCLSHFLDLLWQTFSTSSWKH